MTHTLGLGDEVLISAVLSRRCAECIAPAHLRQGIQSVGFALDEWEDREGESRRTAKIHFRRFRNCVGVFAAVAASGYFLCHLRRFDVFEAW